MTSAAFRINSSPYSDRGYDTVEDDDLTLELEDPSVDVWKVQYSVVTESVAAPAGRAFTPSTGLAATPSSTVNFNVAASTGPYVGRAYCFRIRCQINNGVNPDGSVNVEYTKDRLVSVADEGGLRAVAVAETTEYDSTFGWVEWIERILALSAAGSFTAQPSSYTADANKLALRDADGDIEFRWVFADELVAKTTNVEVRTGVGGYVGFSQDGAQAARINIDATVGALDFQTATARIACAGDLKLWTTGGQILLQTGSPTPATRVSVEYANPDVNISGSPDAGGVFSVASTIDLGLTAAGQAGLFGNTLVLLSATTASITATTTASLSAGTTLALSGTTTASLTAGGILTLQTGTGTEMVFREGATEFLRGADVANVSTLTLPGTSGSRIVSSASGFALTLSANGGAFQLQNGTTNTVQIDVIAGTTTRIRGQGTASTEFGTVVASAPLLLKCGAGSQLRLMENTVEVFYASDETNVSVLSGKGSGGTEVNATTGRLDLKCAAGSTVRLQETGASSYVEVDDQSGVIVLNLSSGTASLVKATNLGFRGEGYIQFESPNGSVRGTIWSGGGSNANRIEWFAGAAADTDAPTTAHRFGFLGTGGVRYFDARFARKQTAADTPVVVWTSPDLPAGTTFVTATVNVATASGATGGTFVLEQSVRSDGATPVLLGAIATTTKGTPNLAVAPSFTSAVSGAGITISADPNTATGTHFQLGKIEVVYGAAAT